MIHRLILLLLLLSVVSCSTAPEEHVVSAYTPPKPVYLAPPQYPFELRKAGVTGKAVVEFIVSKSGDVVEAHAVEATHPLFATAAVEAVLRCKYTPGMKAGVPVNTRMQIPLSFDLK